MDTLKHDALKKMYTHTVPVNTIARGVMHRFRVDIFYNASGKMAARSSPGFSSVPVYPCDREYGSKIDNDNDNNKFMDHHQSSSIIKVT